MGAKNHGVIMPDAPKVTEVYGEAFAASNTFIAVRRGWGSFDWNGVCLPQTSLADKTVTAFSCQL